MANPTMDILDIVRKRLGEDETNFLQDALSAFLRALMEAEVNTQAVAWDLWFGTQNTSYHAFKLPAAMLVCADGDGVSVRQAPGSDATIVALLKDLTQVRAEEFVLTTPATASKAPGTGSYRISSPAEGWVHSSYFSDAKLNDCALRDYQR